MTLSRDEVYNLVKDVKALRPEDLETDFVFQNLHGHKYSPFNSMFLLMQGALSYYPNSMGNPSHVPVVAGGKNQWLDTGRAISKKEEENCFYIWVPSMNRKKAVARMERTGLEEDKKNQILKRHRFYLCKVWLEPQTDLINANCVENNNEVSEGEES